MGGGGIIWRMGLLDRVASRVLKLPPATSGYTVDRGLRVPMRDGVELVADHYAPTGTPLGTLLVRGPYGRGFPFSLLFATAYAARGYHVVLQSVRGTYGSGDEFQPMFREVDDGADTVAWLREQPWFTGTFGTVGLSYLGFTQWALLADPPPELVASVVLVGPHDFSRATWGTGAFTVNDFLGWSDMVAHQEDPGRLRGLVRQATGARRMAPALQALPLRDAGERLLAGRAPWYREWVGHPDPADPWWAPVQLEPGAGARAHPRAAHRRVAGPLPGPDPRPVPEVDRSRGRRGADGRPLDPRRDPDQGRRSDHPGVPGLAGPAPRRGLGRQRVAPPRPGAPAHHGCRRVAVAAQLAPRDHRAHPAARRRRPVGWPGARAPTPPR